MGDSVLASLNSVVSLGLVSNLEWLDQVTELAGRRGGSVHMTVTMNVI